MTDWAHADGIKNLLKGASKFGAKELLVLEHLKGAKEPLSGQTLAAELSVTRAAVWKHIKSLRTAGYGIEGTPSGGYVLGSLPRRMYAHEIPGDHIFHFNSCGSTNDIAKELATAGAPDGTMVIADEQSAGKGRRGRSWVSPPGGIYMSVVTRPTMALDAVGLVTIAAAVAAVMALRRTHSGGKEEITIKWPNDILLGERKLGGILCEMAAQPDQVDWIVVGLGLNLGVQSESELDKVIPKPASLKANSDTSLKVRSTFLSAYIENLRVRIERVGSQELVEEWTTLSSTIGQQVEIGNSIADGSTKIISGRALRLRDDGALVIKSDAGKVAVVSGDLVYG